MSLVEDVETYRRVTQTTRDQARAFAASRWAAMTSWSDQAADELVRSVVPVVEAAERTTAAATVAYVERVTGRRPAVDLASITGPAVRNGASPLEVYRRPIIEARAHYSKNKKVETAVDVGLRRLLGNVELDTQRAATLAARDAMTSVGVREYRRVTSAGSCPLCVAASDRVYYTSDLLPIHTNCHCIVLPASRVPDALRPETRGDDRGLRINDHGEIGPVLEWDDVYPLARGGRRAKPPKPPTAEEILAGKRAQLEAYEKLLAEGNGTDFTRAKVAELRAELGIPEPQPLTLADEIAQLRDDYKALDGDWINEAAPPALAPGELERLKEIEADLRRQINARYDELQRNAIEYAQEQGRADFSGDLYRLESRDFQLAKLRSELDKARDDLRKATTPVRGGSSAVAEARLDKALEAGDKMLGRVQERVAEKLAAGPSPLEEAARLKAKAEVDKATAKWEAAKAKATEPVERAFFKERTGLDITLDDYFKMDDPPTISDLTELLDRRDMRLRTREVYKYEKEVRKANRALRNLEGRSKYPERLAWREAVHEVLAEVRPMGGDAGSTFVSPRTFAGLKRGRVKEALEEAAQSYPTEWLEAQGKKYPYIQAKKVKRGYWQSRGKPPEIALSESSYPELPAVDLDGMLDVATHELGHTMEYAVPDVAKLEWVFLRRRITAPDGTIEKRTTIYKGEYGYKDNFTNHYTGKTYERSGRGLDTPDEAYELFTTGVQALFTGGKDRFAMGLNGEELDEDFIRFMLGVLSIV